MDKPEIRKSILGERVLLGEQQHKELSFKVIENVMSMHETRNARRAAVFLPIRKEVDTMELIRKLVMSDTVVCLPVVDKEKGLSFSTFISFEELVKGEFGVLEPLQKIPCEPESIDLFFLPGIAFDYQGRRLGWGKAYYDRFFNETKAKGLKVGLAFDFQVLSELPTEEHDILVDVVVTDKKVIRR